MAKLVSFFTQAVCKPIALSHLCQSRDVQANKLAVIVGSQAQVTLHDCPLNIWQRSHVERLDNESGGIRGSDASDLLQRSRGTVVLHLNAAP